MTDERVYSNPRIEQNSRDLRDVEEFLHDKLDASRREIVCGLGWEQERVKQVLADGIALRVFRRIGNAHVYALRLR